ncbi:MAG: NCS2 family permease, partial [Oscillospiraceae bacterium]|nr:NCS2 family permease [Oscillospiraceae bacterium]
MEKFFKLKENGTNVRTEVIAGITTFLAMAYILAVNPQMLAETGMNQGAVFTATAVSAAFATLIMGVFAKYPVALASGMGLNAYFTYTVCEDLAAQGITDPWKVALTAILVEGIIFIILSLFKFRETLVNSIPTNLKFGITAGIGLFITIIGLKGAGIVTSDAFAVSLSETEAIAVSSTLVQLGNLASPQVVLAFVGLIAISAMSHFRIKGSILWGILLTWILGIVAQLAGWYQVDIDNQVYSLIPSFDG